MVTVEKFKRAGYTVSIHYDTDAEAPEQDEEVFIVTTRNREFVLKYEDYTLDAASEGEYDEKYWTFPVYAYIHGGIALSLGRAGQFSDPWDSGQIGICFVSKSSFGEEPQTYAYGTIPTATQAAEIYIETWNQYLSGQVYGYVIEGEEDSCWGFYGLDYCIAEAKSAAEYCRKHEDEEAAKIGAVMHL